MPSCVALSCTTRKSSTNIRLQKSHYYNASVGQILSTVGKESCFKIAQMVIDGRDWLSHLGKHHWYPAEDQRQAFIGTRPTTIQRVKESFRFHILHKQIKNYE